MFVLTYKLPGREKTFTGDTIAKAHDKFKKDYAEAVGEIKKVLIDNDDHKDFKMVVSYKALRMLWIASKKKITLEEV
jgi:ribosomal protein L28